MMIGLVGSIDSVISSMSFAMTEMYRFCMGYEMKRGGCAKEHRLVMLELRRNGVLLRQQDFDDVSFEEYDM